MNLKTIAVLGLLSAFGATGCNSFVRQAQPTKVEAWIKSEPRLYTPIMSSTVGIGLTGGLNYRIPAHPPKSLVFKWRASYGTFLAWAPPDYKVRDLGAEVSNGGEKIFWSYDAKDMGRDKPEVTISLVVKDAETRAELGAKELHLRWKDASTAEVR
jgi:hypothetical protein